MKAPPVAEVSKLSLAVLNLTPFNAVPLLYWNTTKDGYYSPLCYWFGVLDRFYCWRLRSMVWELGDWAFSPPPASPSSWRLFRLGEPPSSEDPTFDRDFWEFYCSCLTSYDGTTLTSWLFSDFFSEVVFSSANPRAWKFKVIGSPVLS